jgi:hypothetical protein
MMKRNFLSKLFGVAIGALILSAIFPIAAFGQGRWCAERSRRSSRLIVYQPRSYVAYQRRPYRSSIYANRGYYTSGYTYGYNYPYYSNRGYSYRYSQPYFAKRYTYSWANPTYVYRARRRSSGLRLAVRLR